MTPAALSHLPYRALPGSWYLQLSPSLPPSGLLGLGVPGPSGSPTDQVPELSCSSEGTLVGTRWAQHPGSVCWKVGMR